MFSTISIFLIICILIFFLITKRNRIYKLLRNSNKHKTNHSKSQKINAVIKTNYVNKKVYSNFEKSLLKKEMIFLFKGSKEDKLKALNIAKQLSDKSTLQILKIGLKDMDSDIVKISANLIQKFK